MSDNCKLKVREKMKEVLKEEELDKFLSEEKLDMFVQDIADQKALWGGDHLGYKKHMAKKIQQMEAARKIYAQKKAFNLKTVADQKRWISETSQELGRFKGGVKSAAEKEMRELLFTRTLGGANGKIKNASNGTANKQDAMFQAIAAPMAHKLKQLGVWDSLAKGDPDLQSAVLKELKNLQSANGTGQTVTNNIAAFEAARVFKSALDAELQLKQEMGLPVQRLDGYTGPRRWDRAKVAQFKNGAEFRKYIESTFTVDEKLTFGKFAGDEKFKAEYYDEMYNSIITGAQDGIDTPGVGDEFISVIQTRDYYKAQSKSRKIHFKGENDDFNFLQTMGNGNFLKTTLDNLDAKTRALALMQDFGTDPQAGHAAFFERTKRHLKQKYKDDPRSMQYLDSVKYDSRFGIAGSNQDMFNYMSGKSFTPGNSVHAKVATVATTIEALSKLGAASISALGDIPRSIAMLASQTGSNPIRTVFEEAPRFLMSFFDSINPAQRAQVMERVAWLTDFELHINGFSREDAYGVSAGTQKINRMFNKATFLEWVTKKTQQTMAISVNKQFAEAGNFHQLSPAFKQNYIDRYGFTEKGWEVLQAAKDGEFINIEAIDKLPGFSSKEKLEAKQAYYRAISDIAELASGEANSRARFIMTAGKPIDDIEGTARRIVFQFKSFMFSQHHALMRAFNSGTGTGSDLFNGAQMMIMTAAGWHAADMLKKKIRGQEQEDLNDWKTYGRAFVRSGAVTPFTELLLGPSRFDSNYEPTAMGKAFAGVNYVESGFKSTFGPASGLVWDSAEAFGKALEQQYSEAWRAVGFMTKERLPFKNLWYRQALAKSELLDPALGWTENINQAYDSAFGIKRNPRRRGN